MRRIFPNQLFASCWKVCVSADPVFFQKQQQFSSKFQTSTAVQHKCLKLSVIIYYVLVLLFPTTGMMLPDSILMNEPTEIAYSVKEREVGPPNNSRRPTPLNSAASHGEVLVLPTSTFFVQNYKTILTFSEIFET
jgi:hypothetical protein